MANTTNYNWETPDDTDLVKDGAAAIRTLGSSIDTTTKALNPETTLGDIAYRSATANTNTRLAIGTTGQVLTVAAGVPSWATPAAAGGKVLQVVSATTSTSTTIATDTYTDTTITATITPTASNSKILVIISANQLVYNATTTTFVKSKARILRGGTQIVEYPNAQQIEGASATYISSVVQSSFSYLDSPATTSATTYKLQGASANSHAVRFQEASSTSVITLLEIGA